MVTDKTLLMKIRAIDSNISDLNEQEFEAYLVKLSSFCKTLPVYEKTVQNALPGEDYDTILKAIEAIREMVSCCEQVKVRVREQLSPDSELDRTDLELKLSLFLKSLSMLSDDAREALSKIQEAPENGAYIILAVDDTSFFLQQLKLHLKGTSYNITCVNSGDAALRFLTNNRPDLFLLDIDMPGMNGYELAKEIRARGITQPIIFLTSHARRTSVVSAVQAGGSDYIVKPCTKEQILKRIEKHLG